MLVRGSWIDAMIWGFGIDGMSANIFPAPLRARGDFSYFPIYCKIATERKQPIWMIRPKFKNLQAELLINICQGTFFNEIRNRILQMLTNAKWWHKNKNTNFDDFSQLCPEFSNPQTEFLSNHS